MQQNMSLENQFVTFSPKWRIGMKNKKNINIEIATDSVLFLFVVDIRFDVQL